MTVRAEPRAKMRQRSPRLTYKPTDDVMLVPSGRFVVPVLTRTTRGPELFK